MQTAHDCTSRPVIDLVDGRGAERKTAAVNSVQLFGTVCSGEDFVATQLIEVGAQWYVNDRDGRERLWVIECGVDEAYRDVSEGVVSPLTYQQIIARQGATGFSRRGVVQLEIFLERYGGEARFRIDGGQTIEVYAVSVSINLLVPTTFVEVARHLPTPAGQGDGTVVDNVTRIGILSIEESRGRRDALFSQRIQSPANQSVVVEIPPFAREAQIRQGPDGNPSQVWTGDYGPFTSTGRVSIPFHPTNRETERFLLGDYSHLRSDIDVNDRQFVASYRIQP